MSQGCSSPIRLYDTTSNQNTSVSIKGGLEDVGLASKLGFQRGRFVGCQASFHELNTDQFNMLQASSWMSMSPESSRTTRLEPAMESSLRKTGQQSLSVQDFAVGSKYIFKRYILVTRSPEQASGGFRYI